MKGNELLKRVTYSVLTFSTVGRGWNCCKLVFNQFQQLSMVGNDRQLFSLCTHTYKFIVLCRSNLGTRQLIGRVKRVPLKQRCADERATNTKEDVSNVLFFYYVGFIVYFSQNSFYLSKSDI